MSILSILRRRPINADDISVVCLRAVDPKLVPILVLRMRTWETSFCATAK